jgi:CBS domain-containing protein
VPRTRELICVNENDLLIDCLQLLGERGLSAAPVIRASGEVIGVCSRSDVLLFIPTNNQRTQPPEDLLFWPIGNVVGFKQSLRASPIGTIPTAVHTCRLSETLEAVLTKLLSARVYRLVVVDEETGQIPISIIALSDLLRYFVVDTLPVDAPIDFEL